MDKLFLIRVDPYHQDTLNGDTQVSPPEIQQEVFQAIQELLPANADVTIWSSPFEESLEAAETLQEIFSAELVTYDDLRSGKGYTHDFDWLKSKLDTFEGSNLIIVSQIEYVERFLLYLKLPYKKTSSGNGLVISNHYTRCNVIT